MQRVGEECVLDVSDGELEVLLLVLEAKRDAAQRLIFRCFLQQARDTGIDVPAIAEDFVERRARKRRAQLFFRHFAEALVIAVEEPAEVRMERRVIGDKLTENEGFKEPGRMGEMPFEWRCLSAGLHHHVLGAEWSAELDGFGAHRPKAGNQRGGERLLNQHISGLQSRFGWSCSNCLLLSFTLAQTKVFAGGENGCLRSRFHRNEF